ncbi:MAG: M50 family metallopeptidase [Erysipelotrichaceae bacterium]|nr:M50 family metallopeptidase [Erysipelotrichaceae bacterium]
MGAIKTLILFLIMLTAITSVHECGHFVVAKLLNVYVKEFSIGMGKELFSKKGKETKYTVRMLPLGGYCAFVGEEDGVGEEDPLDVPEDRTLYGAKKWKRLLILFAGTFMNIVLAIFLVAMIYLSIGKTYEAPKPIISEVVVDTPAYNAGLMKDDFIKEVSLDNGYSIKLDNFSEFSDFMNIYKEGNITLKIDRNGEEKTVELTPVYNEENEAYVIGIRSYDYSIVEINIFNCFKYAFIYVNEMVKLIITSIIGLFRGVGYDNLSGPVGVYNITSQAVSYGFMTYVNLIATLSLNIGLINLAPIPVLDGGKIVITIIEMIIRRRIPKKIEEAIMIASVALFVLLMVFATGQDLFKLMR